MAMQNLVFSYQSADRLEEALGLEKELLQLRREKLGPEHPDTVEAMVDLAFFCSETGRLEEALGLEEEVLRLRRAKLGPDHPETLGSMGS